MSGRLTGKKGIRAFLLLNVGEVVRTEQIRDASGNQVQYGRRMRELRDEEGWPIQSHHDSADLKPGEYRLVTWPPETPPVQFARSVSAGLRAQVLERNGYTCRMCGIGAGDPDDRSGRPARLHVGHVRDKSQGGSDSLDNLRALCSSCNQGAKNITQEPPSRVWLMQQVRRAKEDDQRAAFEWLQTKFQGELK